MEVCSENTEEGDRKGLLQDIIKTVSASEGFFRHQQKDEADLTLAQKSSIASDLLSSKPGSVIIENFTSWRQCPLISIVHVKLPAILGHHRD